MPNHAEKDGTFVNVEWRLQKFGAAYPAPGQVRPLADVLVELLARYDSSWAKLTTGQVFDRLAGEHPAFVGLSWDDIPAVGVTLNVPQARAALVEEERTERGAARHGDWKPWFPVIDYDRCTNCMQCLSFCLFGVYGVDGDGKIQAQNHDNCKTNCPACSRVCPEAAIMFPKYKAGPINGDSVSAADLEREKMKIDISALLGGDVYQMLRLVLRSVAKQFCF